MYWCKHYMMTITYDDGRVQTIVKTMSYDVWGYILESFGEPMVAEVIYN